MRIVLWDTRRRDVSKDFAGGFGVGQYRGRGLRSRVIRWFYKRDRRPTALVFAYLAAIFRKHGHSVEYYEDAVPTGADVYVFHPSLITLDLEREAILQARRASPRATILVLGLVAHALPEAFADLDCTIVDGEPEAIHGRLDEVIAQRQGTLQVGAVANLDELPMPNWSLFQPARFRIGYDFTRFPTGLVQASRGCALKCCYCPYIVLSQRVRSREPECVAEEIRSAQRRWGFRSFKFRDPLFGANKARAFQLADLLAGLPNRVQFSIESRIDVLSDDLLRALRAAGLTSITVGIETPDDSTLRQYRRAPIADDRQMDFIRRCHQLGIRSVAGFMIGFPNDTRRSIRDVLKYAKHLNPTFANFNVCTPYPGTGFFEQVREQIADFGWSRYNVYTPVLRYEHLTADEVSTLHQKCFESYYFRWRYLREAAPLLWPWLRRFTGNTSAPGLSATEPTTLPSPHHPRARTEPSKVRA